MATKTIRIESVEWKFKSNQWQWRYATVIILLQTDINHIRWLGGGYVDDQYVPIERMRDERLNICS